MFQRYKKMSVFTLGVNGLPVFDRRHSFVLMEKLAHGVLIRKAGSLCNFIQRSVCFCQHLANSLQLQAVFQLCDSHIALLRANSGQLFAAQIKLFRNVRGGQIGGQIVRKILPDFCKLHGCVLLKPGHGFHPRHLPHQQNKQIVKLTLDDTVVFKLITGAVFQNDINLLEPLFSRKPVYYLVACGTADPIAKFSFDFAAALKEKGYPHETLWTDGAHTWKNWRHYLMVFAERLFK